MTFEAIQPDFAFANAVLMSFDAFGCVGAPPDKQMSTGRTRVAVFFTAHQNAVSLSCLQLCHVVSLIQLPFEHLQQEILLYDAPMWDRQEVLPVPLYIYGQQRLPSKIPQLNSRRPPEGWGPVYSAQQHCPAVHTNTLILVISGSSPWSHNQQIFLRCTLLELTLTGCYFTRIKAILRTSEA